jgi:hypothetical protein
MEPPPSVVTSAAAAPRPKAKPEPPAPTSPLPTEEDILQELLQRGSRGPSTANELRAALMPRYAEVRGTHINQHLYRLEKEQKVKRIDTTSIPPRWVIICAVERTALNTDSAGVAEEKVTPRTEREEKVERSLRANTFLCSVLDNAELLMDHLNSTDWGAQGITEAGFKAILMGALWRSKLPTGCKSLCDISEEGVGSADRTGYLDLRVSYVEANGVRVNLLMELKYVRVHYITALAGDERAGVFETAKRLRYRPHEQRPFLQAAAERLKTFNRDQKMQTRWHLKANGEITYPSVQQHMTDAEHDLQGKDQWYRKTRPHEHYVSYIILGIGPCVLARILDYDSETSKFTTCRLYPRDDNPQSRLPPDVPLSPKHVLL